MAILQLGGGNCGYINRSGKIVITPRFDYCTDFVMPEARNTAF
ncbi:WG repeat-containing protein [Candidatus Korobacter versatilis]